MPPSEIAIQTNGLLERATLVPLRQPNSQAEAETIQAQLRQLHENAAADAHCVLNPTHLMVKGGKIVGYLSLNALPVVHCWFDSKNPHIADSLKMIEHGETVLRTQGVQQCTVACAPESPFSPHLERLGFTKLGSTVLWIKTL